MKPRSVAGGWAISAGCIFGYVAAQGAPVITAWDIQTQPGVSRVLQDAGKRFESSHAGYTVQRSPIANEAYKVKLKIAVGANQPPCVFANWGGGLLREYVKAGQVLDLSPYLARDEAFRARFLPRAFDATTFDGKVYGLPGEETSAAVVFYNAELFRRHGLKPPRTWPELMALVGTLKGLGIAPFALANKSKWPGSMYFMYLVDRIGGPDTFRKAAARTGGEGFAAPAFVEAGRYLQELVKAGAFAPGFNGLDHDTGASRRLLYAGKAAMTLMGSWELGNMQNENPAFRKKVDFFPFPTVPNGKGASDAVIGSIGTNFYSISSACKSPEAAYALIKTMVDDEAVRARLANSRMVPVKGLKVADPLLQRLMSTVVSAPSVQLWYDQELPPQLAELHKDTVQALFGLSMTPEQAALKMEALAARMPR